MGTSPNSTVSISSVIPVSYVVVWEWENRPTWWRPYSPEVTQLLERAHQKQLNKIYLKDADPDLSDFSVDMTNFEQLCEPTGATYPVRREFYKHTTPAGKGCKWEWSSGEMVSGVVREGGLEPVPARAPVRPSWHMYDMEVQIVIEEAWDRGDQTIDVSKHFPGCGYIINFCNLTQVRSTTGQVRQIRRVAQAAYPMVRLTQAEIAVMMHRKDERMRLRLEEVERRRKLLLQAELKESTAASVAATGIARTLKVGRKLSGKKNKVVRQIISHIFSHNHHHSAGTTNHGRRRSTVDDQQSSSSSRRRLSESSALDADAVSASRKGDSGSTVIGRATEQFHRKNGAISGGWGDIAHFRSLSLSAHNVSRPNPSSPPRKSIGHPSALSECNFSLSSLDGMRQFRGGGHGGEEVRRGRRHHQAFANNGHGHWFGDTDPIFHRPSFRQPLFSGSDRHNPQRHHHHHQYGRFHDYSSFSSFSDTSSMVRRPSMDTISTYLSNGNNRHQESAMNGGAAGGSSSYYGFTPPSAAQSSSGYGYGYFCGSSSSGYGLLPPSTSDRSRFSSGDLLVDGEHDDDDEDDDSVFTDEDADDLDVTRSTAFAHPSRRGSMMPPNHRLPMPPPKVPRGLSLAGRRERVLSDPEIHRQYSKGHGVPSSSFSSTTFAAPDHHRYEMIQDDLYSNVVSFRAGCKGGSGSYVDCSNSLECPPSAPPVPWSAAPARLQSSLQSLEAGTAGRLPGLQGQPPVSASLIGSLCTGQSSSPMRGATIHDLRTQLLPKAGSQTLSPVKKRPVPTPRTILNFAGNLAPSPTASQQQPPSASTERINAENEENQMRQEQMRCIGAKRQLFVDPPAPGPTVDPLDKLIRRYTQPYGELNGPDDYCPSCAHHLDHADPPGGPHAVSKDGRVVLFTTCGHKVHLECLRRSVTSGGDASQQGDQLRYIRCPTCSLVFGRMEGNMPSCGATMTYKIVPKGLPGYEDYHTIQITYNFPETGGVQGPEHPNPGQPYYAIGFPRTAFLPDTEKGRRALRLLEAAFEARLTFTIDPGNGEVVWNDVELPHKTEFGPPKKSKAPSSYPDDKYVDTIIAKLERLGITDEATV